MIEDLPHVPPALLLIYRELPSCKSWAEMRRRVKGMLRELRDQSEAFEIQNFSRSSESHTRHFHVHLHGPMDLLSDDGCRRPECRLATADRIARSVGLIADRVWLTDLLTEKFVNFGRPTNAKLDEVITDVLVLARLFPLIKAGVICFRSPWVSSCESCLAEFQRRVDSTVSEMMQAFADEFRIERRSDGGFYLHTGHSTVPPIVRSSAASGLKRLPRVKSIAKPWVHQQIRSALWTAREAAMTGGAVFSSSKIGLAGLLHSDGRRTDQNSLALLDRQRDFTIPWVTELNSAQIVQLREEASSALPLLRERLCKAMAVSDSTLTPAPGSNDLIAGLREQAAEVRAELDAKRRHSARFWKATYGILGLGLSAYGVAADQLLPGVGGLLPVIHLLITHKTGHESDVSKIASKPGYVLVKAQDILSHADSQ
jgi:hypothetical protein